MVRQELWKILRGIVDLFESRAVWILPKGDGPGLGLIVAIIYTGIEMHVIEITCPVVDCDRYVSTDIKPWSWEQNEGIPQRGRMWECR